MDYPNPLVKNEPEKPAYLFAADFLRFDKLLFGSDMGQNHYPLNRYKSFNHIPNGQDCRNFGHIDNHTCANYTQIRKLKYREVYHAYRQS
jgi:hypothetical protein